MFFGKKKDSTEEWTRAAGAEARAHPRMGLRTIVAVQAFGRETHCRLHDLSLGGLALLSPWEMTPADPVSIQLPAPEGLPGRRRADPANLEGRVCRCVRSQRHEGWQVGVRFTRVSPDATALIRAWFDSFGEAPEKPGASRPGARGGKS